MEKINNTNLLNKGIERIYLTKDRTFERSFDIYYKNNLVKNTKTPIVIMIMGSGWLGHTPFVYTITNWWNKTLALNLRERGITCIFIRHRGACIQLSASLYFVAIIIFPMLYYFYNIINNYIIGYILCVSFWNYISSGDARYNTMIDDYCR